MAAIGRLRTLISAVSEVRERPLSGKADIQILAVEISVTRGGSPPLADVRVIDF